MSLFNNSNLQKTITKILNTSLFISAVGLLLFLFMMFSLCFRYVKPYEYGVKQVNIGINRGIQNTIYNTGLHFVMPFGFEEMHIFPKLIQVYELSDNAALRFNAQDNAANIQTSDGFFVSVDVSILYRIKDPVNIIKTIGPGNLYITNGIMPKAEPVLKDTLGQLTTEEFYNPYLRVEKMRLAKFKLDEELSSKGIQIDNVLIRYFRYSDEIQRNIEEKKLKDQLVFKNKAEAKAAIELAKLSKTIEEGEALLKVELEKGNAYVTKRNAEELLYSTAIFAISINSCFV